MNPKLAIGATIVTSVVTLAVTFFVTSGAGAAAASLIVALAAFVMWVRSPHATAENNPLIVPYVGVIVINLLLNAARYWSGYADHLATAVPQLFAPHFAATDVVWFLSAATVPTVLMLAGCYALLRGHIIGRYTAWWAFAYAVVDGTLQLAVEFGTSGYDHRFFVGALAAVMQIAIGIAGWMQSVGRLVPIDPPVPTRLSKPAINLWTLAFIVFGVVYGTTLYTQAGFMPVIVIVGSMVGGLIAWRRTTALVQPDRLKIVPLYMLMLALFYFHVGEEGLTGFNHAIALISGTPWSDGDFIELIGLLGPALWIAGGLGMWLRQAWGNFLVWFMVVGMLLGEPMHHILFPVLAAVQTGTGYTYFPAMVTALFPMIPAVLIAVGIFADRAAFRQQMPGQPTAGALGQQLV
jgi:hypothetical protein